VLITNTISTGGFAPQLLMAGCILQERYGKLAFVRVDTALSVVLEWHRAVLCSYEGDYCRDIAMVHGDTEIRHAAV
jgi:hypothetical protein